MIPAYLFAAIILAPSADARPGDWPQWRGPNRDGVSRETGLLKEWPKDGPPKVWTMTGCGGGYGTVAVSEGFIYGGGRKNRQDCVWCLRESDGELVWNTPFTEGTVGSQEEGVRGTPTVAGGRVYCVSGSGILVCLDAKTGRELWKKDYVTDFGGSVQGWGYCESVLVDGDRVICTPCSNKAAVVALDAASGKVIWKTAVTKAGGAGGYSSPVKMTVGDTPTYVNLLGNEGGVVGVDAKSGRMLWQYTRIMNGTANIPTPVVKGDRVFCSTGYGDGGSALLRIRERGGKFSAEELKYYKSGELQNHHGGMVLVGDHIYLGNAHNSGHPACVELQTGEIVWKETRGAGGGSGSGSVVAADGMLYFRYENGKMALVRASPEGLELKGSFDIPQKSGKPSWQHPVIANGKLYLRDQDKLHCFDLKAGG